MRRSINFSSIRLGDSVLSLKFVFFESYISYDTIKRYKPYAASNFVVSLNETDITLSSATYSDGQLFYFYDLAEDVIKKYSSTTNTLTTTFFRSLGICRLPEGNLSFTWGCTGLYQWFLGISKHILCVYKKSAYMEGRKSPWDLWELPCIGHVRILLRPFFRDYPHTAARFHIYIYIYNFYTPSPGGNIFTHLALVRIFLHT